MKKILISLFILAAFTPFVAWAQEYTLLEPLPCIEGTSASGQKCSGGVTQTISFNDYIGYVFKFSIALAVFLAIIMVIWGGIQYMTSEVPFLKIEGKNKIEGAVTGLVMVLASYLILATIDPRLVEIQTSVPAIKIETPSVKSFQESLSEDLKNLSNEVQVKTNEFVAKKKTLQQELDEVNGTLNDEYGNLTSEEQDELEARKESLEQQIRGTDTEISKTVATNIGLIHFNNAISALSNESNYTEDVTLRDPATGRTFVFSDGGLSAVVEENIKNSKETIIARYKEYISKIGNTDPAAVQLLQKQRDFYISQIDSQAQVDQLAVTYKKTYGSLDGNDMAYRRIVTGNLNNLLVKYKGELENPQQGTQVGLESQYKLMVSGRIETINNALNFRK